MFRLGDRDTKNADRLGHRDTENADKKLRTKLCWDTRTLKMQTGWDTGISKMQTNSLYVKKLKIHLHQEPLQYRFLVEILDQLQNQQNYDTDSTDAIVQIQNPR